MAVKSKSGTLTANTVATVQLTTVVGGFNVVNRAYIEGTSTAPIWVRFGAGSGAGVPATVTDPTVGGDECFPVYGARNFVIDTAITVKLICSAANAYTVESVK